MSYADSPLVIASPPCTILLRFVAWRPCPIIGESDTRKELIAHATRRLSRRVAGLRVDLNYAAFPGATWSKVNCSATKLER
jgi:hypothetical protein